MQVAGGDAPSFLPAHWLEPAGAVTVSNAQVAPGRQLDVVYGDAVGDLDELEAFVLAIGGAVDLGAPRDGRRRKSCEGERG